jgi:hypothetical protein
MLSITSWKRPARATRLVLMDHLSSGLKEETVPSDELMHRKIQEIPFLNAITARAHPSNTT